jgi:predicted MFS family arabinose efflux permease
MTGFIAILTETLPAGLLPEISHGLNVPESWGGQMVTLYAPGSIAAIPVTAATRAWSRRTVLLLAIALFFVFNTITAVSPCYGLTLAARFMAGVAAGVTWGLVPGYSRRIRSISLIPKRNSAHPDKGLFQTRRIPYIDHNASRDASLPEVLNPISKETS